MGLLDRALGRTSAQEIQSLIAEATAPHAHHAAVTPRLRAVGYPPKVASDVTPELLTDFLAVRLVNAIAVGDASTVPSDLGRLRSGAVPPVRRVLPLLPRAARHDGIPPSVLDWTIDCYGGCRDHGRCQHDRHREAALGLARWVVDLDGPSLLELLAASPDPDVLVAAASALHAKGRDDDALSVLALSTTQPVPTDVRRAMTSLLYTAGRFDRALAIATPGDPLYGWVAAGAVAAGVGPAQRHAEALAAAASAPDAAPAVVALDAEARGDLAVAESAWRRAGFASEARQAAVYRDPTRAQIPEGAVLEAWERWLLYAAGRQPRPGEPSGPFEKQNAAVGEGRAWIVALRGGDAAPPPASLADDRGATAVARLRAVIADEPRRCVGLVDAVDPRGQDAVSLARELASHGDLLGGDGGRLRAAQAAAWRERPEPAHPIALPASPAAYLAAGGDGIAAPSSAELDHVAPEIRLAVLAMRLSHGDPVEDDATVELLPAQLRAACRSALPELVAFAAAVAGSRAKPETRRPAGRIAGAALAHLAARRLATEDVARAASDAVSAAVADIGNNALDLTPREAFDAEIDALRAFPARMRHKAIGPVLTASGATSEPGATIPPEIANLYGAASWGWLLLGAGHPDAAGRWMKANAKLPAPVADPLAGRLVIVDIDRAIAGGRPADAVRYLQDRRVPTVEVADRAAVAARALRDATTPETLNASIGSLEGLVSRFPGVEAARAALASLLNRRGNLAAGVDRIDISVADFERAMQVDPTNPHVKKNLAYALVGRAVRTFERAPMQAAKDVDRATDLYMGDAELVETAAGVANAAGVVLANQGLMAQAWSVWRLVLSIDPRNARALDNLRRTGAMRDPGPRW